MQDSYRLQYGQYSGRAGDALTAGGVMEQWSACVNGMQFTTRDQVHEDDNLPPEQFCVLSGINGQRAI